MTPKNIGAHPSPNINGDNYSCEWCGNSFTLAQNLRKHQRSAKYCLKLRGDQSGLTTCKWCLKNYTTEPQYKKHAGMCPNRMEKLVKKYKKLKVVMNDASQKVSTLTSENEKLKEELAAKNGEIKGMKKAPVKTITNNTTNAFFHPKLDRIVTDTIRPLTIETVVEDIEGGKYTEKLFHEGVSGLVSFVSNIIKIETEGGVERNYACTDTSRNKFFRLVHSEDWEEDNGAHFLTHILNELKPMSQQYFFDMLDQKKEAREKNDEISVEIVDEKIQILRPIHRGISGSENSKDRIELCDTLRNKIKKIAAV